MIKNNQIIGVTQARARNSTHHRKAIKKLTNLRKEIIKNKINLLIDTIQTKNSHQQEKQYQKWQTAHQFIAN